MSLLEDLIIIAKNRNIYDESIKAELIIALSNYDIREKETELVVYDEMEYNEKIIKKFIVDKIVAGCTERTQKHYIQTLKFVCSRINKPLNLLTADDIKLYLAVRQKKDGISDVTAGNEWRVISTFYTWMTREEIISKNPMLKVDCPKKRKKKKKAFTEEEVEKIRDGCQNLRDKAIIEVLLSTWCRATEVSNMKISDINSDGSMLVFGKGEKERCVYLNARAQYQIDKYLQSRTDDKEWLFVSQSRPYNKMTATAIRGAVKKIGREMGVANCHPHRFRRTGATFALRNGMPVENVSKILGHEELSTTQIYLDMDDVGVKASHEKYSR